MAAELNQHVWDVARLGGVPDVVSGSGPVRRRIPLPVPAGMLRLGHARIDACVRRFRCRPEHAERVRTIGRTFLDGYNAAAGATRIADIQDAGLRVPRLYRPFFFEGACMGYGPYAMRHGYALADFERFAATLTPATRYQNYVGFGWWLAMVRPVRDRTVRLLDFRYRDLCHEGAGFMTGFFDAGDTTRAAFRRRARVGDRTADRTWLQGYGRALWFVHMGDIEGAVEHLDTLPAAVRDDLYSGLGLGVGFSWLDRASAYAGTAAAVPAGHAAAFEQGMAFGLEARAVADPDLFDELLPPDQPSSTRWRAMVGRVRAAHDELLRAGPQPDFYNRWRARLIQA